MDPMPLDALTTWWRSVPIGTEFAAPAGACGGLFRPDSAGGWRCRAVSDADYTEEIGLPVPPGYGAVEFWAFGVTIAPLEQLASWSLVGPLPAGHGTAREVCSEPAVGTR